MKFQLLNVFCTTPNDSQGGVWQGGQGFSTDGNHIYVNSGNGVFDPSRDGYAMSVIKLSLDLKVVDYFTPSEWKRYSAADEDVAGCGNMLVPNTPYLFTAVTKYGGAHLVDTRNMGKWNAPPKNDSCKQTFILAPHIIFPGGNPVGWSDGKLTRMYAWAPTLPLYQFTYNSATDLIEPITNWNSAGSGGLFVSSNGNADAILWAFDNQGDLYAFDASKDVSTGPIWKDETNLSPGASWTWPMVVNGRVYIACGDGTITIYGLK